MGQGADNGLMFFSSRLLAKVKVFLDATQSHYNLLFKPRSTKNELLVPLQFPVDWGPGIFKSQTISAGTAWHLCWYPHGGVIGHYLGLPKHPSTDHSVLEVSGQDLLLDSVHSYSSTGAPALSATTLIFPIAFLWILGILLYVHKRKKIYISILIIYCPNTKAVNLQRRKEQVILQGEKESNPWILCLIKLEPRLKPKWVSHITHL